MENYKKELEEFGVTVVDTIKENIFTKDEIEQQLNLCDKYIKDFFREKGLELDIDPNTVYKETQISKTKKDTPEYNACYTLDNGKLNVRDPAISKGCGIGRATSQREVYYDPFFISQTGKLRKLFTELYDSPVCQQLERFGYKIPSPDSTDMALHTDMVYTNDEELPPPRKVSDPQSYGPYSNDNKPQRLQAVLCLNDSEGSFYYYPGAHKFYKQIGKEMDFPKIKNGPQTIKKEILENLNLERKEIKNEPGKLIIWNCAIPHGNTKVKNTTPRVVKYINFHPYKKQSIYKKIAILGK